jgi:UDPglucose 6-dehydrogenase
LRKQICVVGTGYVGMASAIGLAELGHDVRGYDIVAERIRSLKQGITPYREAGIDEPLRKHIDAGNLSFFETLEEAVDGADFIIVCVGTPAGADGSCDLSSLYAASHSLKACAPKSAIIVMRSTTPPGTTDRIEELLAPMHVLYAPEFLREGTALLDFLNPARIVVGTRERFVAESYLGLFSSLGKPSIVTASRNAELIKGCSNAFLALKISFANQVANICDGVGADALEVLHGVGADPRIGSKFLEPGIGFGGPCFEKDVKSLNHISLSVNAGNELFAATLAVNKQQPHRIVQALVDEIGSLQNAHVGVWGLAFKAGTDDTRDSIAVRIVDELISRGARVTAYDPAVEAHDAPTGCVVASSALAAASADALLILTEWPEFSSVDVRELAHSLSTKVIIDGRNVLNAQVCADAGLHYRGIGRKILAQAAHVQTPAAPTPAAQPTQFHQELTAAA